MGADPDELSLILEELHYEQFGYSIEDGKTLTKLGATEPEDWSRFEEPTFLRYGKGVVVTRRRSKGSNH